MTRARVRGRALERIRGITPPTAVVVGGVLTLAGVLLGAVGVIASMRSDWLPLSPAMPLPLAAALVAAGVAALLAAPVVVAMASRRPAWIGGVAFVVGVAVTVASLTAIWALVSIEAAAVAAPVLGGGSALVASAGAEAWWRRTGALLAVAAVGGGVAHVLRAGGEIIVVVCWVLVVVLLAWSTSPASRVRDGSPGR